MSSHVQVTGLNVLARDADGNETSIVKDVGFSIARGEVLALIGESGSGKTTIALALMGYVRSGCRIASGSIRVGDTDILALDDERLRSIRGRRISYIAQSAAAAFDPSRTLMNQVIEAALIHGVMSRTEAQAKAIELFRSLALPDPEHLGERYPHQVSGGQLQRLMAAMALITDPELVILDEPTTALDVTTQIEVLRAFKKTVRERGTTAVYVSHDLAVVAQMADRIVVLNRGEIRETGATQQIIDAPADAYTQSLIAAARPALRVAGDAESAATRAPHPLLEIRGLAAGYGASQSGMRRALRRGDAPSLPSPGDRGRGRDEAALPPPPPDGAAFGSPAPDETELQPPHPDEAAFGSPPPVAGGGSGRGHPPGNTNGQPSTLVLNDINLTIARGATLGVIGESGSGKSTLARVIAGLVAPASGSIFFDGKPLPPDLQQRTPEQFRRIQIVFQNADTALNPAHTVARILGRPLELYRGLRGDAREHRIAELLDQVRLPAAIASRRSSELSGGQKQRINLARALAAEPDIILCDEVTSALDTVVGAAILDLMAELRRVLGVSYMFISHDISTVRAVCDDIVVLYAGRKVEAGRRQTLLAPPFHPYTNLLISSVPELQRGWLERSGAPRTLPSIGAAALQSSSDLCTFLDRCPLRIDGVCNLAPPLHRVVRDGKEILCHRTEIELQQALAREQSSAGVSP